MRIRSLIALWEVPVIRHSVVYITNLLNYSTNKDVENDKKKLAEDGGFGRWHRCRLCIGYFKPKISQHMIRECFVDVDLVAFLGVFCKATGEVATHGHFLTGRRAGAPRTFISSWCAKVKWLGLVMLYWINFCASTRNEILAVIFDDSVYLHGVVETNEAPELSFDLFRILFRAIIISTMRNYLSKNSHTHPMKTDQTKIHARHFMWCRCMLWCSVVFSFYLMTVFFFREVFPH